MPLGSNKITFGTVREFTTPTFTPQLSVSRSITQNSVTYNITSNYTTQPVVNYDFTGLSENIFNESETGNVQLDANGNASITKTLDQTSTYSDTEFAINIRSYNDLTLFASGANVNLNGNVAPPDLSFVNTGNVTLLSASGGYKLYSITGNTPFRRIDATDPGYNYNTTNILYELIGGGGSNKVTTSVPIFLILTPGRGGSRTYSNVSFNNISSTTDSSNINIGAGGDFSGSGTGGSSNINLSYGFSDQAAGGSSESQSLVSQTQNNTTLWAQRGGNGAGANGNNGSIVNPPNLTAVGGNGGAGVESIARPGTYYAGGGGGGAAYRTLSPDGYTYSAIAGGKGSGGNSAGGGASGYAGFPTGGGADGNNGIAFIKIPYSNYPVFS